METNVLQIGSTEDSLRETKYAEINTPDNLYIPKMTSVHLNDLGSQEYSLRFPIQIIIVREHDNYYIAQHPFLGLWVESKKESKAIKSLQQKILQLYKKLKALSKDKLGPFPQDCLIYLENHIS